MEAEERLDRIVDRRRRAMHDMGAILPRRGDHPMLLPRLHGDTSAAKGASTKACNAIPSAVGTIKPSSNRNSSAASMKSSGFGRRLTVRFASCRFVTVGQPPTLLPPATV